MKTIFLVYVSIALVLGLSFVFQGISTQPTEGDSLAYHLPIARNILQGKFSDFENESDLFNSLLQYYPGASHLVLATFVVAGLPQLFNVIGWLVLVTAGYLLGLAVRLSRRSAFVLAVVLATLTAAVRLLPTQTIDLWLTVFYTLSLALILLPVKSVTQSLALGLTLGMLIGSKFTGPALALPLLFLFWPTLRQKNKWQWYVAVFAPILVLGCSWYLRNLYFRGDLFYPASHPAFSLDEWQTWQTIIASPAQFFRFVQALVSEYSIYALLLLAAPVALFSTLTNRLVKTLIALGLANFALHLLTPASPVNLLSDLRYTLPTFICLISAAFVWAKQQRQLLPLAIVALIPIFSIFSLVLAHRPKLFFIAALLLAVGFVLQKHRLTQNVLSSFRVR